MGLSTSNFFLLSVTIFMASSSAFGKKLPVSAVSAAPTLLPGSGSRLSTPAPAAPPALSPDISPLLPSPGGYGLSPTPSDSSLPIIPSNPSPTKPGPAALSPGPSAAFAPMGVKPESSSLGLSMPGFLNSILVLGFVVLMH